MSGCTFSLITRLVVGTLISFRIDLRRRRRSQTVAHADRIAGIGHPDRVVIDSVRTSRGLDIDPDIVVADRVILNEVALGAILNRQADSISTSGQTRSGVRIQF